MVKSKITLEIGKDPGMRPDGHHLSHWSHLDRCDKRQMPDIGADIDNHVARAEVPCEEHLVIAPVTWIDPEGCRERRWIKPENETLHSDQEETRKTRLHEDP